MAFMWHSVILTSVLLCNSTCFSSLYFTQQFHPVGLVAVKLPQQRHKALFSRRWHTCRWAGPCSLFYWRRDSSSQFPGAVRMTGKPLTFNAALCVQQRIPLRFRCFFCIFFYVIYPRPVHSCKEDRGHIFVHGNFLLSKGFWRKVIFCVSHVYSVCCTL